MKVKLEAGANLDLLTKGEVMDVLRSWQTELTRGARVRRYSMSAVVDAGGNVLMGDNRDGPEESNAWGITRFTIAPGATIPAGGLAVYVNEVGPSQTLVSKLSTDLYPDARGCMIQSGDSLRIAGSGFTVGQQVTVTMSIREVPVAMAWSL